MTQNGSPTPDATTTRCPVCNAPGLTIDHDPDGLPAYWNCDDCGLNGNVDMDVALEAIKKAKGVE